MHNWPFCEFRIVRFARESRQVIEDTSQCGFCGTSFNARPGECLLRVLNPLKGSLPRTLL